MKLRYANRLSDYWFPVLVLLMLVMLLVGLFFAFAEQDEARARCSDSGGTVVEIHGGRGGWFCQR